MESIIMIVTNSYEKLSYIMKSIEDNEIFACAFGEGKDYPFCDGSQSKKRY